MEKHFVNKYKSSHEKRAKRFKKLESRGLVFKLESNKRGVLYGVKGSITISISRKGNVVVTEKEIANKVVM